MDREGKKEITDDFPPGEIWIRELSYHGVGKVSVCE
jgi:hypothetical protein